MSTSDQAPKETTKVMTSSRAKKAIAPKVWKRPHSTIYGKNVEFGSALYSDKIGEINSRKFHSDLPWSSSTSSSSASSYGNSDGRKLSMSSIDPKSYRPPARAQKNPTAHSSDGDELVDKTSPFYTDRWAGKTIRHFDSDLYSNASLFKSMIL